MRNIKKLFVLSFAFITLFNTLSFAQCKLDIDKVDKFNGMVIQAAKWDYLRTTSFGSVNQLRFRVGKVITTIDEKLINEASEFGGEFVTDNKLIKVDDTYHAATVYFRLGEVRNSFSVDKSSKIIIMFGDETKLELFNLTDYTVSTPSLSGQNWRYAANLHANLSKEEIKLLKNNKISAIRFKTKSGYVDVEVKKKRQKYMPKQLDCLFPDFN